MADEIFSHVFFMFLFYCPDNVAYLSHPGQNYRERQRGQGEDDWEDNGEETDPIGKERWSSATMKILSSMPSRTIGGSCCES